MPKHHRSTTDLGGLLTSWREAHWPPTGMKKLVPGLEIYQGTHEQLTTLSHSLSEVMLTLESHIQDVCGGRVPRWMAIPKLVFHAERVNLVEKPAKASKRFSDMVHLLATCGKFPAEDSDRLVKWFATHPGQELVGHRLFRDLRAFVHSPGAPGRRLRFCESGLAVAPTPGADLILQDHRTVIRGTRSDAFSIPLAISKVGWRIFVPMKLRKPRS